MAPPRLPDLFLPEPRRSPATPVPQPFPEPAVNLRARMDRWVESTPVQTTIIALIVVNAIILGLETSDTAMARWGDGLLLADQIILGVFVVEIAVKLAARGPSFFRNGWDVFDFVVVGIALVPASGPLAVLRALRVLRVLRLMSAIPQLRFVVDALLKAVPGIGSIFVLIGILFYVFAVIATSLFGESFPDWFGTIPASLFSLFQIMTLESWSMGIVRPVMEVYPLAWLFFVPFILVATFTMLNLFIGIIVDTMQTLHDTGIEEGAEILDDALGREHGQIQDELQAIREELRGLRGVMAGAAAETGAVHGSGAVATGGQ
ncbi:MAG: ion transporter [Gemmatimonadales bacterium]|nr:MAG: ion transporter [Gemmatimonadales bacterium]